MNASHRAGPTDAQRRRVVLCCGSLALVGLSGLAGCQRDVSADNPTTAANTPVDDGPVTIVVYNDQGQRVGEQTVARVVKTPAEWHAQLSDTAYHVTRESGTERAYSGAHDKPDQPGIYRCICCDNALYDADTQFHSGTGWPSFWQPIAAENVVEHTDRTFGMTRTEIACTRCNAHLGHVFHDGPRPTGLRYCMNAVAMRFQPITGTGS